MHHSTLLALMRSIVACGTLDSTKMAFTPLALMKSTVFATSARPASLTVEMPCTPTTWKPKASPK